MLVFFAFAAGDRRKFRTVLRDSAAAGGAGHRQWRGCGRDMGPGLCRRRRGEVSQRQNGHGTNYFHCSPTIRLLGKSFNVVFEGKKIVKKKRF